MRTVLLLSLCTLCWNLPAGLAAPPSAPAESASTENVEPAPMPEGPRYSRRGRFGEGIGEEWEQMRTFMREYSPRRLAAIESMPREGGMQGSLRRFLFARWRNLQGIREEDPTVYEMRVQRLKAEDDIWGLIFDWKKGDEITPSNALRKELRQRVGVLVDLGVRERQHRIERLEKLLASEREKVEADKQNREAIIDERVEAELAQGLQLPRPERPAR